MPRYAFTFKKDDIFVEFVTSDKDVVERQFQIWVADADDYASKHIKKNMKKATPSLLQEQPTEQVVEPPSAEHQQIANEAPVEAVVEPLVEAIIEPQVEPVIEAVEPNQIASVEPHVAPESTLKAEPQPDSSFIGFKIEQEAQVEEAPEVFDNASNLLRTINTIQNPPQEEEKQAETVNFEDVLEKSIENPTFEPAAGNKDQIFLNLIRSKNTNDRFHALMITSYYLSEFEKRERFTLKQINSKLMQNLSMAIDHTTLQEAINQNFIELVPDLTGTSEVGEYRLTNLGEEFFARI